MTLGGGGGGYNEKYVEDQHKYDIQKWLLDWQEMQDAFVFQKDTFDIKRRNQEDQVRYQNEAALQEWKDKEMLRPLRLQYLICLHLN